MTLSVRSMTLFLCTMILIKLTMTFFFSSSTLSGYPLILFSYIFTFSAYLFVLIFFELISVSENEKENHILPVSFIVLLYPSYPIFSTFSPASHICFILGRQTFRAFPCFPWAPIFCQVITASKRLQYLSKNGRLYRFIESKNSANVFIQNHKGL